MRKDSGRVEGENELNQTLAGGGEIERGGGSVRMLKRLVSLYLANTKEEIGVDVTGSKTKRSA